MGCVCLATSSSRFVSRVWRIDLAPEALSSRVPLVLLTPCNVLRWRPALVHLQRLQMVATIFTNGEKMEPKTAEALLP